MIASVFDISRALACYVGPLLVASIGLGYLLAPAVAWRMHRWAARAKGLATADAPEGRTLTLLRLQGVALLLFAVGFAIVAWQFFG